MSNVLLEHRIRERAYELWERDDRVHGRAEAHWNAAKLELTSTAPTGAAEMIEVPARAKPRRKAAMATEVTPAPQAAPRRRRSTNTLAN